MSIRRSLLPVTLLALGACDYGAPDEVASGVIVYTAPLPGADFAPLATYYVDPQMRVRKDGEDQPDQAVPATVMAAIDAGMTAAGYTAAPLASADVGLKLAMATNSVDYYYSGGWCDIYYGWYGCYYPPVYAGSYRYGTVILGMVDLTVTPDVGEPFPGLWFSVMYGIAYDYPAYNPARVAEGVTRSFDQSPYL